jgi:hypothetical protein
VPASRSTLFALSLGVALTGWSARARAAEATSSSWWTEQRATLLASALDERSRVGYGPATGWVLGGAGLLLAVVPAVRVAGNDTSAGEILAIAAPGGILALGSFGSYAFDESYYERVIMIGAYTAWGTANLEMALWVDEGLPVFGVSAASTYLEAGLLTLDALIRKPTPRSVLIRDMRKLRGPSGRGALSVQELREIEGRFERGDSYLSPWLLYSPLLLGGVANGVLTAVVEDNERLLAGTQAAGLLLVGAVSLDVALNTGFRSYVERSQRLGFSVQPVASPSFVGLSGSF